MDILRKNPKKLWAILKDGTLAAVGIPFSEMSEEKNIVVHEQFPHKRSVETVDLQFKNLRLRETYKHSKNMFITITC